MGEQTPLMGEQTPLKNCPVYMGVSKNRGFFYPKIIHFNRVFHDFYIQTDKHEINYLDKLPRTTLNIQIPCVEHMSVSKKYVFFYPKSSILIGFSLIFTIHFGGFPAIFGNTHIFPHRFDSTFWLNSKLL